MRGWRLSILGIKFVLETVKLSVDKIGFFVWE